VFLSFCSLLSLSFVCDNVSKVFLLILPGDPVEIIVSGYLYHKNLGTGSDEAWADMRDDWCRRLELTLPFGEWGDKNSTKIPCVKRDGRFYSYRELLNVLPKEEGIFVEAARAWRVTIKNMLAAYTLLEQNSTIGLNLCLEDFYRNFTQARQQLYSHIGVEKDGREMTCLLALTDHDDPGNKRSRKHATTEYKSNGEKEYLEHILRNHTPTWERLSRCRDSLGHSRCKLA
jgi:hypothetical protein